MNTSNRPTRLPILAAVLCGAFAAAPVWAAPTTDRAELAELATRHRQERAACMNVQQVEARADCLRDTDVAYAHARRHRADTIDPPFAKNATLRCEALRGDDHKACLARMDGRGTTSGSVAGGGIYRELVVVETTAAPLPPASGAEAPVLPTQPTPTPMTTPMTPTAPMTMPASPAAPMAPMTLPAAPAAAPAAAPPSATNAPMPK